MSEPSADPLQAVLAIDPREPRAIAAVLALGEPLPLGPDGRQTLARWAGGHDAPAAHLARARLADAGVTDLGPTPLILGPWRLAEVLGGGGMGAVYRARHLLHPLDAAVKVVKPGTARPTDDAAQALSREAAIVARLRHPGIAALLDVGTVGKGAELTSRGQLRAGSRFVVSEWVPGGELRARCGRLSLGEVRRLLLSILDALAHAHAHAILHLDLKPNNVLLTGPASAQRPVLVDFGLSHAKGSRAGAWSSSGTPPYMAPERFLNQWRRFGPPTDLFAVGGLAYNMVTGTAPFRGSLEEVQRAVLGGTSHLVDQLPGPPGLRDWIARCTALHPTDRFPTAAAAARALAALDLDDHGLPSSSETIESAPTIGLDTFVFDLDEHLPDSTPSVAAADPLPPLPVEPPLTRPITPTAVSLGHGFPALAVWTQREAAARLWGALREAEAANGPVAVCLSGGAAADRAILRSWLGRAAGARGWWWLPIRPGTRLGRTARHWLDAVDLAGPRLAQQLAWRLGGQPDDAWIEALTQGLDHDDGRDAARATLRRVGAVRPLVVTATDRRPAEVDQLLQAATSLHVPLLIVAPAGAVPEPTHTVHLRSLAPGEGESLLDSLAGLSAPLARAVMARSGGSMARAVEEVTHLAASDGLVPGPYGLTHLPSVPFLPTADLSDPSLRPWLVLARVLGADATQARLAYAAHILGLAPPTEGALHHALRANDDGQLAFVEPAIAASCAPGTDEAPAMHGAAAAALAHDQAPAYRIAHHALRSGHPADALEPLLGGMVEAYDEGRLAIARDLLAAWDPTRRAAGVPDDDPRHSRALLWGALIDWGRAEAMGWAEALRDTTADPQLRGFAELAVMRAHHEGEKRRRPDVPTEPDREALAAAARAANGADLFVACHAAWIEAVIHDQAGDLAAKAEAADRSSALGLASGDPHQQVKVAFQQALLAVDQGRLDEGCDRFVAAAEQARAIGSLRRELTLSRGASAYLRVVGRIDEARAFAIRAVRLGGHADEPLQEFNLALMDYAVGRTGPAIEALRRVQGLMSTRSEDAQWLRRAGLSVRVVMEADTLDDGDYRPLVEALETQLCRGISRQVQLAWFLEEGAIAAAQGGVADRARWLGGRAMHWYTEAAQPELAERVRRRLHTSGGSAVVPAQGLPSAKREPRSTS